MSARWERYKELRRIISDAWAEKGALHQEWAEAAPWKVGDIADEEYRGQVTGKKFMVTHISVVGDCTYSGNSNPQFRARGKLIRKDGSVGIRETSAYRDIEGIDYGRDPYEE